MRRVLLAIGYGVLLIVLVVVISSVLGFIIDYGGPLGAAAVFGALAAWFFWVCWNEVEDL